MHDTTEAPTPLPPIAGTAEMARLARVSTRLLFTLRGEGMPHIKRGQLILFEPAAALAWLRDRYGSGATAPTGKTA